MSDLHKLTLVEAISGLKEKKFSHRELIGDVLVRIRKVENKISSYISINEGASEGIPFAVKEVLSTKDIQTTASSKILERYVPPYDATVVEKVKKMGNVIIGKTNCDAFAFGASTENSGFGPTKNPWDLRRTPGGSSGGSAAAVAADECIFALGTDTGGSIRQPASFCNVTGLKPTYGACSRYGLLAMGSSFDCPGPMAKTVEDCEIVFDWMKGMDEKDGTTWKGDLGDLRDMGDEKSKLTIGLPKEFFEEGIDREVKETVLSAAKIFEQNGYGIKEISLPHTQYGIDVYYILVPSEISSNMARYTGTRFGKDRSFFEDEVKRRIMIGTYTLSAGYFDQYYAKALKVRSLIQQDYLKAFEKVDIILGPVAPTPAFKLGEKQNDPLQMYLSDVLTVTANLAGVPGLALPAGFSSGNLPIGMQIIGPHFSEKLLFSIGKKYQELTEWHKKRAKIE